MILTEEEVKKLDAECGFQLLPWQKDFLQLKLTEIPEEADIEEIRLINIILLLVPNDEPRTITIDENTIYVILDNVYMSGRMKRQYVEGILSVKEKMEAAGLTTNDVVVKKSFWRYMK